MCACEIVECVCVVVVVTMNDAENNAGEMRGVMNVMRVVDCKRKNRDE